MTFPDPQCDSSLRRWERAGLGLLLAAIVVFGGVVLLRSALLNRRMGDCNVFTRAAWAVRTGGDLYEVTDGNGFHYVYPPIFAILLTPLADAPAGKGREWMLPYPATVAIWYVLNLVFAALAMHVLASAFERGAWPSGNTSLRCSRWWRLRLWPLLACLPAVGHTLMRGQVGLLLLLLLCGMLAALMQRRSFQAGCWLAAAICLKVIPAFLLIYPLWRRDKRCLAGCAAGLAVGLLVVPAAVRGPRQTWADYRKWTAVVVLPAADAGQDQSRARELIDVTATDSQSISAAIHNTVFFERATRPRRSPAWIRVAALGLIAALTLATFCISTGAPPADARAAALAASSLIIVMLAASPVCHLHYLCLAAPLVMGLLASDWEQAGAQGLSMRLGAMLALNIVCQAIPHFPGMEAARDVGLAMYATLTLWLAGQFRLVRLRRPGNGARFSPGQRTSWARLVAVPAANAGFARADN
jgi:hypothetical protein